MRERTAVPMVISFGSINMDLVMRCEHIPAGGETVVSSNWFTNSGGKGANQAVQAARLGSGAVLIGRVGADVFGQQVLASLSASGVNIEAVATDPALPTGIACVLLERSGENRIIVAPGTNAAVGVRELELLRAALRPGVVLMLQCEIPCDVVFEAAHLGRLAGATVLLDPSPWQSITGSPGMFADIDYLMPNEAEACGLGGSGDARQAADNLLGLGAGTVIVKMGEKGVYVAGAFAKGQVPAFPVPSVDTTAAGDAFQGAFASSLEQGFGQESALYRALAAGALTVTRPGAQQSMPDGAEIEAFLKARRSF